MSVVWNVNNECKRYSTSSPEYRKPPEFQKMRFSPELSAAVVCSVIASSQCRPQDTPGVQWHQGNDFVRIYRTEMPWNPIDYQGGYGHESGFADMAWVAVLSVAVSAAFLVLLFCVCWRLCTDRSSRRQNSNANLMQPNHLRAGSDGVLRPSGNIYGTGVVNLAFTSSLQDPVPIQYTEDKPPEYWTVVTDVSPNDMQSQPLNSDDSQAKPPLETPPPAYVSETPFSYTPH